MADKMFRFQELEIWNKAIDIAPCPLLLAKPLGLPDDPRELSHSVLAEERMEEKFSWLG